MGRDGDKMRCDVMYVRFNYNVIGRPGGRDHWAIARLKKEKHHLRFDFDDAHGKRRGSWDEEVTELISRANTLPSQVEAGLGQGSNVANNGIDVL